MAITLKINNKEFTIEADPKMPLLWAIRDLVGLTGTKYEIRVRHRSMRGLHCSYRRPADAFVQLPCVCRRKQVDYHDRRTLGRQLAHRSTGMDYRASASMRLLPVGANYGRCCLAEEKSESNRQRYRHCNGRTYLPMWDVPANSESY
jgi:hypothetical protein